MWALPKILLSRVLFLPFYTFFGEVLSHRTEPPNAHCSVRAKVAQCFRGPRNVAWLYEGGCSHRDERGSGSRTLVVLVLSIVTLAAVACSALPETMPGAR